MSLTKSLYRQSTPQFWELGCTPNACDQLELSTCASLPSVSSTVSCSDVDFWSSEPQPDHVESDLNWLLQLTQDKNDQTTNYECSIPAEIVDFVTSYDECAHSPTELSEFNWFSLIPSQPSQSPPNCFSTKLSLETTTPSNSPTCISESYSNPSQPTPRTQCKGPSPAFDRKSATSDVPAKASIKLRKRQSNRDAAFRYRQKMKEKYSSVYNELKDSMLAYNRAKLEYERARDAFDALKKVILDLSPPLHS